MYKRTFQKLLDAISYVGGIFEAVIGMFFFMMVFGKIFYEFKFAKKYFRSGIAGKPFTLKTLIQQIFYKGLSKCGFDPEWPETK